MGPAWFRRVPSGSPNWGLALPEPTQAGPGDSFLTSPLRPPPPMASEQTLPQLSHTGAGAWEGGLKPGGHARAWWRGFSTPCLLSPVWLGFGLSASLGGVPAKSRPLPVRGLINGNDSGAKASRPSLGLRPSLPDFIHIRVFPGPAGRGAEPSITERWEELGVPRLG